MAWAYRFAVWRLWVQEILGATGMEQEPQVVQVVVRAKHPASGDRFAIVEFRGGELGITRNDKVIQTVRFAVDDMEGCVREFVKRTGLAVD
jgi:hypothetical protein